MGASGKAFRVNGNKIFNMITRKYRNVNEFCVMNKLNAVTFYNLINGKKDTLRADTLFVIADALDCTPGELM